MITSYNKLVRDRIPEIIEAKGKRAVVRILDDEQYQQMLDAKLQEELTEYIEADEEGQVEELADLLELVYAILNRKGVAIEEFETIRRNKKAERGGFDDRLYLIRVEER